MMNCSSNLAGYLSEANLLSSKSSIIHTSVDLLKSMGLYDKHLESFQTTILTHTENMMSKMPLPAHITKDEVIFAAVKSSTESLKATTDLLHAIRESSKYRQSEDQVFQTAMNSIRKLFEVYKQILNEMEKIEFRIMIKSNMPSSYFSDSVLAYRSLGFFADQEFNKIHDSLNRTYTMYRGNRKKLEPAFEKLEEQNDYDMTAFNQLGTFHSKLRLYVNLWNTESAEKAFELPVSINFDKLDKDTYSEFYRLFRENLLVFRRKIVVEYPETYRRTIEKKKDEPTQMMWKELLQPLVAQ